MNIPIIAGKPPTVSVIIPTHNRAQVLLKTLESVRSQTYPSTEIVIVDDGSTDETPNVLATLAGVQVLRQPCQGVEMARRQGIAVSTGKYLTFLDDDDLMVHDKIERQAAFLEAHPEIGVVHCGYRFVDEDGNFLETSGRLPEGDVIGPLVWGCFPWSGGPLLRRECLAGYKDDEHPDWYGDWGMWLRTAIAGYRWGCIQEPLGDYRIVRGSMIDNRIPNAERLVFHILEEVFERWNIPPEVAGERGNIYAGWHLWLSCRYYNVGAWKEAGRNLLAALRFRPQWRRKPEGVIQVFFRDAVSPRVRVADPMRFAGDIFDHLPAELSSWIRFRKPLLMRVRAGLSLRDFACGRIMEARRHLEEALEGGFSFPASVEGFRDAGIYARQAGSIDLAGYVEAVLGPFPIAGERLKRLRSVFAAEMELAAAAEAYACGQGRIAVRRVFEAVGENPLHAIPALVRRSFQHWKRRYLQ